MGLVVQATPDAMFAPLAAVSGSAGGDATPANGFAAVLAAVSGPAGSSSPGTGGDGLSATEVALPAADPSRCNGEDPLAGAVAAAIALSLASVAAGAASATPASSGSVAETCPGGEATSTAGVPIAGEQATVPAATPAGTPSVSVAIAQAEDSAVSVDTNTDGPPAKDPVVPAGATAGIMTAATTSGEQGSQPLAAHHGQRVHDGSEGWPNGPDGEASPPGEAAGFDKTGVVRSVGNATNNENGGKTGNGDGSHAGGSQTMPHASAQGVVHASEAEAIGAPRSDVTPAHAPHASAQGIPQAADVSAVAQLRPDLDPAPKPAPHGSADSAARQSGASVVPPVSSTTDVSASSAPPAPAAPTAPQEVPTPMGQIGRAVIERVQQGGGEARIQLSPADLGDVVIKVKIAGDRVQVAIHAERQEAVQVLRAHTVDLSSLLGGRGLDLADVFVGQGDGRGRGAEADIPWQRRKAEDDGFGALMGIDESAGVQQFNRLRAAYNPDGAHIYRI